MAGYKADAKQDVLLNQPILFYSFIPCPNGNVIHDSGSGIFILRGPGCNSCNRFARYKVVYNGNIAVPTGVAVSPIAVGITVNGELETSSRAISTPAAVEEYNNVTSVAAIDVPRGIALTVSVRAVSGITVIGGTPASSLEQINGLVTIDRVA